MEIFVIVNDFSRVFFDVFPHVKVIDLDLRSAYDIGKIIANQGFAIFPVKVRKYIIKVFLCKKLCITRLINANISVNEQPEWFHWAQRRWPIYTYCTSRIRFRSWSFYRYRKRFGDLDQWPWHVEKHDAQFFA
jgi:hypothetical protein